MKSAMLPAAPRVFGQTNKTPLCLHIASTHCSNTDFRSRIISDNMQHGLFVQNLISGGQHGSMVLMS